MIYLDTSALIKLYLYEEGSEQIQEVISSQYDALPIWELQEMELANALRLKVFWGDIENDQVDTLWALFERRRAQGQYFFPELDRVALVKEFHRLSRFTDKLGCRSIDILHVATASLLSVDLFVSYDKRQCTLAKHIGLALF